MSYYSVSDIYKMYPGNSEKIYELYSMSQILNNAIRVDKYVPDKRFGDIIVLSPEAEEIKFNLSEYISNFSNEEIKIAFFMDFYFHDLHVDVENIDIKALKGIIHDEIKSGKLKFIYQFETVLYDKYFEIIHDAKKDLNDEETKALLNGTLTGVYQLKNLVVGPLGLMDSLYHRDFPPIVSMPLWHCPDNACNSIHLVKLSNKVSAVDVISEMIVEEGYNLHGTPSDWSHYFMNTESISSFFDDKDTSQLPWLLGNGFSEIEIQHIFSELIKIESKTIRGCLPVSKKLQTIFKNSPDKISNQLTKPECVQFMLCCDNTKIVEAIENAINTNLISIPSTEIRGARTQLPANRMYQPSWECSELGVRVISQTADIALLRLKVLLSNIFSGPDTKEQLSWTLREFQGETLEERIDQFVHREDPRNVLKNTIFMQQRFLLAAFEYLKFGKFDVPSNVDDENRLIDKMLWKLGFDMPRFPRYSNLFWERHEKFLECSRTYRKYTELDREQIRSAGVNFFVSLEEILDYSLSFITWVLLSDHYIDTNFTFSFDSCRKFMASKLSGIALGAEESIIFNPNGVNTLFPLIQGFKILSILSTEIVSKKSRFVRPKEQFPRFSGYTNIIQFPFHHTHLLLDINPNDLKIIVDVLNEVTSVLEGAQICAVRNKIQHNRKEKEFPDQQDIEKACVAVADIVSKLETSGICPLLYLYNGQSVDQYSRMVTSYINFKNTEHKFFQPSQFSSCNMPDVGSSFVIVPWIKIGDSIERIRFRLIEESDFFDIWKNYPRRLPVSADSRVREV